MFFFVGFFSVLLLCKVQGGELLVAKNPPSIKLQGDGSIDQNLLPEIFSAALGFTTQNDLDWKEMKIIDPFGFAEALVVLYVDGIPSLGKSARVKKYKLHNNENIHVTWKNMRSKIVDRYPMENNTIVNLDFDSTENIDEIETNFLSKHVQEDAAFLKEITGLNRYVKSVKKSDGVPDFYWFNVRNLHQLSDLKGAHHQATKEARDLVYQSLLSLSEKFSSVYKDQVLVVALISDASHTRRARSVAEEKLEAPKITDELKYNIYDPDFPVIFNIILWFTVALIISLLAVSVFIASMDPGRDSIIYRMTSNRMKKDS